MHKKIFQVKRLIDNYIINTQCDLSHSLSDITGKHVYVKYENKQDFYKENPS